MIANRMLAEMPEDERPRERLLRYGANALTNTELLAILLNTGIKGQTVTDVAERILRENGGFTGLMRLEANELAALHGIGPAKATKLKAAMEIANRVLSARHDDRVRLTNAAAVYDLVGLEMAMLEEEQFRVLLLNTRSEFISMKILYQGSTNAIPVRISEVLREAVRVNAMCMLVVHNHPSGDPTPSAADIALNLEIEAGCKLLGIHLTDHVIIGAGRSVSLRQLGIGFSKKDKGPTL